MATLILKNGSTKVLLEGRGFKRIKRDYKLWECKILPRLKENFHDPSLSFQQQKKSRSKKVQKKQWKKLVRYWNKEETKVRDKVFLKSILNPTEIVAKGWVKSLDPNELVSGKEIGKGWCEVNAQVPIKRDEMLVRPYELFSTIENSIGATVA